MTLPGVSFVTAAALMAAIGDISRFPTARQLVGISRTRPACAPVRLRAARHGRISKQGPGEARHVLVEAAWHAARTHRAAARLRQRIAARRGANIATVAVARKLVVIAWHMLSRGEDYAFARPSLVREKIRKLELATGAERRTRQAQPGAGLRTPQQHRLEKQLAAKPRPPIGASSKTGSRAIKTGAGATPGRASHRPSSGKPRGRTDSPTSCASLVGHPHPTALSQRSRARPAT